MTGGIKINENNTLYIPISVKTENEFFSGFGKKELLQTVIGSIIGIGVSLLIGLITGSIPYTMIGVLAGIAGSVMMTRKDLNNMSVVSQAVNMINFSKSQKYYPYIYGKEWEVY